MRKFVIAVVAALTMITATACHGTPSKPNNIEHDAQSADSANLVQNQPIPEFSYSQIRQNAIEFEKAEAEGAASTTFFFNRGVKDPIFVCPSIGSGIPESASLSNPNQLVRQYVGSGYWDDGVVGQMDPNGIYTATNGTGTRVLCVGADGKIFGKNWEGDVDVVYAPAKWNKDTGMEEITGPASFTFTKK